MSFGRWLLVHSFSLFLLLLVLLGYLYRTELQLEAAYDQLLNLDTLTADIETPTEMKPAETIDPVDGQSVHNKMKVSTSPQATTENKSYNQSPSTLSNLPTTVPTIPAKPLKPSSSTKEANTDNRLYKARQAYWNKNYADAIYIYRQLIQENNFNPDYLGELGNIYYSLNDSENASRLYYQAAMQFIELKEIDRARSLVAPVIAMNRELGEQLKLKLQ